MKWTTEVAHETGHCVIGLLMGGELQNASVDPEYGGGGTRFHFPPTSKSAGDLDRFAFASALYDLAGVGAEWALCGHVIDPQRSADDLAKFRKTFEAHRHTPAFRWARDYELAETVLIALSEQAVRDHEELAGFVGSQLKSFNAISHNAVTVFGRIPLPLTPGADWASWFMNTATRASEWIRDENGLALQREIFNARERALQAQVEALREFDRRANAPR
jgi:hypothetical protein